MTSLDLFKESDINKFLHNPNGPAVIDHLHGINTYFLNGVVIMPGTEEFNKIKHNETFNSKVDEILAQ